MALMLLASISMMAQAIKVTGSVKTETSEPLAGVAVTIKGTTTGTTSGTDGTYSIDVKKGATLVFSFLGMIEKEAVEEDGTVEKEETHSDSKQDTE